jgi:hypothetical protein
MYSMVCTCRNPDPPFVNLGGRLDGERFWVHALCRKPREGWLRSLGDAMLNYFRGGDLDGRAYATSTLLDHQELMEGYRWTSEVIVSKITNATARVWRHESIYGEYPLITDRADLETRKQEDRKPMPTILERREALGVSRQRVADVAGNGMTHAKVWRIEHDGPRTTDEEREIIYDALDQIAAETQLAE